MQTCEYIVVGAGSAGAAVANRLSADPRNKVLLLEAGRASHPWSFIPIGMARLITNPAANWLYSSEPEASTNGRRLPVPRGKLLGGSSSINGMVFVRGQAQDFDTWAQLGNRGWSYTDVLPFFKRMESYAGEGDDAFRGRAGPLRVTNPEPRDPLFATIIKAAAQVGIRHNAPCGPRQQHLRRHSIERRVRIAPDRPHGCQPRILVLANEGQPKLPCLGPAKLVGIGRIVGSRVEVDQRLAGEYSQCRCHPRRRQALGRRKYRCSRQPGPGLHAG